MKHTIIPQLLRQMSLAAAGFVLFTAAIASLVLFHGMAKASILHETQGPTGISIRPCDAEHLDRAVGALDQYDMSHHGSHVKPIETELVTCFRYNQVRDPALGNVKARHAAFAFILFKLYYKELLYFTGIHDLKNARIVFTDLYTADRAYDNSLPRQKNGLIIFARKDVLPKRYMYSHEELAGKLIVALAPKPVYPVDPGASASIFACLDSVSNSNQNVDNLVLREGKPVHFPRAVEAEFSDLYQLMDRHAVRIRDTFSTPSKCVSSGHCRPYTRLVDRLNRIAGWGLRSNATGVGLGQIIITSFPGDSKDLAPQNTDADLEKYMPFGIHVGDSIGKYQVAFHQLLGIRQMKTGHWCNSMIQGVATPEEGVTYWSRDGIVYAIVVGFSA